MIDQVKVALVNKTDESLSKKVSKGTLWVAASGISAKGLNIVSSIIVARLLAPEDFGLMAIAMSVIVFSQSTTQFGFESALIQKQDRPEDFLNTAWTFELSRYLAIFLLIFLAAPLFASLFNEPRALVLLRVISLSLVLQGLRNIGVIYFRKDLDFKRQFVTEVIPVIAYVSVVIPLAYSFRSVWALVWGNLTSGVASCLITYIMHPYRPRLDYNIQKAQNLFKFGKWIFGGNIAVMLKTQGMSLFMGKYLGLPALGFYERSSVFTEKLLQQISEVAWKVGYPTFSKLQDNPSRFKRMFQKTLQLQTFIGIPMAGGLFVLSEDFVHLFLTDKWLPIVPLMQILLIQAVLGIISALSNITFYAKGNPSIGAKLAYLGVLIFAITVYPFSSRWGATGAVSSLFLSYLVPAPIGWYLAIRMMKCTFLEFFKPILISIINTGIMVSIIVVIKEYFLLEVKFVEFFGLIVVGMLTYAVMATIFDKYAKYGIYSLIRERIAAFR